MWNPQGHSDKWHLSWSQTVQGIHLGTMLGLGPDSSRQGTLLQVPNENACSAAVYQQSSYDKEGSQFAVSLPQEGGQRQEHSPQVDLRPGLAVSKACLIPGFLITQPATSRNCLSQYMFWSSGNILTHTMDF